MAYHASFHLSHKNFEKRLKAMAAKYTDVYQHLAGENVARCATTPLGMVSLWITSKSGHEANLRGPTNVMGASMYRKGVMNYAT